MVVMDILGAGAKARNIYDRSCRALCKQYGINQTGLDVIMFLACNPEKNTARDICNHRGFKSGLTSVVLEQLLEKGYLDRTEDPWDGRVKRLRLTEAAEPIVAEGKILQEDFMAKLSNGIDQAEFKKFWSMIDCIIENIEEMDKQSNR